MVKELENLDFVTQWVHTPLNSIQHKTSQRLGGDVLININTVVIQDHNYQFQYNFYKIHIVTIIFS